VGEQFEAARRDDQPATEAARQMLRDKALVGGEVKLIPEKGGALYAHFALSSGALLVPGKVMGKDGW
jgi:hypothetical protein